MLKQSRMRHQAQGLILGLILLVGMRLLDSRNMDRPTLIATEWLYLFVLTLLVWRNRGRSALPKPAVALLASLLALMAIAAFVQAVDGATGRDFAMALSAPTAALMLAALVFARGRRGDSGTI